MYLIIVGAGDIGLPLIELAINAGDDVVVIEQDRERADRVADEFDCLVLHADATIMDTLDDAGASDADGIISTTERDAANVMISLLAKEFDIPSILTVVDNTQHMDLFQRIGVNVMENPEEFIAEHLYRSVSRPAIVDYLRIGEQAEVFEIEVAEGAPIEGLTLEEAANQGVLPDKVLVVALERQGEDPPIIPQGTTLIKVGDMLTVYSAFGADPEITGLFGHHYHGIT